MAEEAAYFMVARKQERERKTETDRERRLGRGKHPRTMYLLGHSPNDLVPLPDPHLLVFPV